MFVKGKPKTGGRKKGVVNVINRDVREMVVNALHAAGGEKYLAQQAKKNPGAFISLLGKTLPRDVIVDAKGSITVNVVTGVPQPDSSNKGEET